MHILSDLIILWAQEISEIKFSLPRRGFASLVLYMNVNARQKCMRWDDLVDTDDSDDLLPATSGGLVCVFNFGSTVRHKVKDGTPLTDLLNLRHEARLLDLCVNDVRVIGLPLEPGFNSNASCADVMQIMLCHVTIRNPQVWRDPFLFDLKTSKEGNDFFGCALKIAESAVSKEEFDMRGLFIR